MRSAFFSGDMTAVVTAMVAFEESVLKAAAAAAADGKTPQAQRREGMLESDMTAIKRQVPGSLLEKKDGSWAVVAIRRGVIDKSPIVISVIEDDGSARERSAEWLNDNVKSVYPGVMAWDGAAGAASKLQVAGVPATFAPVIEKSITKGRVMVGGVAQERHWRSAYRR